MLYKELSNGFKLPMVILGTFDAHTSGKMETIISDAYTIGYRAIDTASIYENEEVIGDALKNQGIINDVIITSKLWNDMHNYDDALRSFEESEKKLSRGLIISYVIIAVLLTLLIFSFFKFSSDIKSLENEVKSLKKNLSSQLLINNRTNNDSHFFS